MELALSLIQHIDAPCEDSGGNNIRDFYIREAEKSLDTFQNPEARQLLKDTIEKYSE